MTIILVIGGLLLVLMLLVYIDTETRYRKSKEEFAELKKRKEENRQKS